MSIIKKINAIFILFLTLLILTACKSSEIEISNEVFAIKDIRIENNKIFIDTEEETLTYPYGLSFRKTDEPSYINVKVVEDRTKRLTTGEYYEKKTTDIFINENSAKEIRKKYANEFKKTLSFIEISDDSK